MRGTDGGNVARLNPSLAGRGIGVHARSPSVCVRTILDRACARSRRPTRPATSLSPPSLLPLTGTWRPHAPGSPASMRVSTSRLWSQVLVRWSLVWSAAILPASAICCVTTASRLPSLKRRSPSGRG
jgi:hypothetical protein